MFMGRWSAARLYLHILMLLSECKQMISKLTVKSVCSHVRAVPDNSILFFSTKYHTFKCTQVHENPNFESTWIFEMIWKSDNTIISILVALLFDSEWTKNIFFSVLNYLLCKPKKLWIISFSQISQHVEIRLYFYMPSFSIDL